MIEVSFYQNLDDSIIVLKSAGQWRKDNNVLYSPIWDPELISREAYLDEFYAHQAYVLYIDGQPTATATLADPQESKLGTWVEKLGKAYTKSDALYIDDIAVLGQKIGQGVIAILFNEIDSFANEHNYTSLRLDFDAGINKLGEVYKEQGFTEVIRKDIGNRVSVFMEKSL